MTVKSFMFFFVLLGFKTAMAFEIKKISITGKQCKAELVDIKLPNEVLKLPLNIEFKKDTAPLLREVCQFSVSIHVKKNETVLVSEVQQGITGLIPSVEVNTELEMRMSGRDRLQIAEKVKLNENEVFILKDIKKTLKSNCGKDAILSGKLSFFSSDSGKAKLKSSDLSFKITSTACQ